MEAGKLSNSYQGIYIKDVKVSNSICTFPLIDSSIKVYAPKIYW